MLWLWRAQSLQPWVLGMNGSAYMDAVVCTHFKPRCLSSSSPTQKMQYYDRTKKRVFQFSREYSAPTEEMAQIKFVFGSDLADAVFRMLKDSDASLDNLNIVSAHDQTI